MSYTVAKIKEESVAQSINVNLDDENKEAFTNPEMDEFYCLKSIAEQKWPSGEGTDYDLIILSQTQVDGTMPLPKRRKIPV